MASSEKRRRPPLGERLKAWPLDFLLWANEARLSIDWDDYTHLVAVPGGLGLSSLYVVLVKILNYYSQSSERRENKLFQTDFNTYERIKHRAIRGETGTLPPLAGRNLSESVWLYGLRLFTFAVFVGSVLNFLDVYVLSYRKYSLMNASAPPKSPLVIHHYLSSSTETVFSFLERIANLAFGDTAEEYDDESFYDEETLDEINLGEKNIYQLNVWDPSKFLLLFFATFSPLTLSVVYIMSDSLWWKLIVLVVLISSLQYYICHKFFVLLHDKQILYQEMFAEYNDKFVKPKMLVLKKDVVIDATYGPTVPTKYIVNQNTRAHIPTTKLKVFITHDINGKPFNHISARKIALRNASQAGTPLQLLRSTSPTRDSQALQRIQNLEARLNQERDRLEWDRYDKPLSELYERSRHEDWRRTPHQDRYRKTPQSRLDTFPKPDLSPNKFSRLHLSRSPSPSRSRASPSFRSPSPKKEPYLASSSRRPSPTRSLYSLSRRSSIDRAPFR